MARVHHGRFVVAQLGWMMAILLVFVMFSIFSYELFLIFSLLGLLALTEVVMPYRVTSNQQRRIYVFVVLGVIVTAYVIIRRIIAIVPEGLF